MKSRSAIKHVIEVGLVLSGVAAVARRSVRGQLLVLAYHNIIPDNELLIGDRANHITLSRFSDHLAALRSTHDVIPLVEALKLRAPSSRPMAALTFDDAYCGALTLGVDEVVRQGLPVTIFVAPRFIGGRSFWWDALASVSGLDPHVRQAALHIYRGADVPVRDWAARTGMPTATVPRLFRAASEEELTRAAARPGVTLGSHSWSHPNLTLLEDDELRTELEQPLTWLRERFDEPLPWLAYPYGLYDTRVTRAAAAAGYHAALGIGGGWLHTPSDRYALPRMNVPRDLSTLGLVLRGAGLFSGGAG